MRLFRVVQLLILGLLVACGGNKAEPPQVYTAGAHPGYAPGRQGELKTITLNGKPLTYEVIDGLAIYQGDMILGPAAQVAQAFKRAQTGARPQGVGCSLGDWGDFGSSCTRWPGGEIPYSFVNDWGSESVNLEMRTRIGRAIAHWQEHTNLRFVEGGGPNRLLFRNSPGCSSAVGRRDDLLDEPQNVNLNELCVESVIIHEIGHAVGLYHEQSREDRDAFVRVIQENIQSGRAHNFARHVGDGFDIGPYDYESIMHYSCFAFGRDRLPTLQPLTPGVTCADLANNNVLSDGDILSAYTMYPPVFEIGGVSAGASYGRNLAPSFRYTAPDPIRPAFIQWFMDDSATPFGVGAPPPFPLSTLALGLHTVRARMMIRGVVVAERSLIFRVVNVSPTVSIVEPPDRASFCVNQVVRFRASVTDADAPPSFSLPDSAVSWRAGSAAPFATGKEVSRSFGAVGTYPITVTATDADGASATASVNVSVVNCTNVPPVVDITQPAADLINVYLDTAWVFDETRNRWFREFVLEGTATDQEDGVLPAVWQTNRNDLQNAELGTGTRVVVRLYAENCTSIRHTITLRATDRNGNVTIRRRIIDIWRLC